jgi:hypothetical protein
VSYAIYSLPAPSSVRVETHEHWPHTEAPGWDPPKTGIAWTNGSVVADDLSDFEHDVACISEGHCPWCEGPLQPWDGSGPNKLFTARGIVVPPHSIDWAAYGWCVCCLYGFRVGTAASWLDRGP